MANCKNCGAALHGNICEYCGTDYTTGKFNAEFVEGIFGTLTLGDAQYKVYIGKIDNHTVMYADDKPIIIKRIFTLIEA